MVSFVLGWCGCAWSVLGCFPAVVVAVELFSAVLVYFGMSGLFWTVSGCFWAVLGYFRYGFGALWLLWAVYPTCG